MASCFVEFDPEIKAKLQFYESHRLWNQVEKDGKNILISMVMDVFGFVKYYYAFWHYQWEPSLREETKCPPILFIELMILYWFEWFVFEHGSEEKVLV